MRGTIRKVSLPRRLIVDLMLASRHVPFVTLRRRLNVRPLAEARAAATPRPGWAAIFTKAFCLVAKNEPVLRTLYIDTPWPYMYEMPRSAGMITISRKLDGEDCVLPQKVSAADQMPLAEVDALIRHARTADVADVPTFRKIMRATALPWPLRRLVWAFGLAVGRQRANYFGNFGVTSVSAFGPGELHALSPGPYIISYGALEPDMTMDVVIRWDHRVTDAAMIAKTLSLLQDALNGKITAELLANQAVSGIPPRVVAI